MEALNEGGAARRLRLRVIKARDVLSEHQARSLWLQSRDGRRFLRGVGRAAAKLKQEVSSWLSEESEQGASHKGVERAIEQLEDKVEDLKREVEKQTFNIT